MALEDLWWWDLVVGVSRADLTILPLLLTLQHGSAIHATPGVQYWVLPGGVLVGAWLSGISCYWRVPEPELPAFLDCLLAVQQEISYVDRNESLDHAN